MGPGPGDQPGYRWRATASPGGLIGLLAAILCLMLAGGALLVVLGKAAAPLPNTGVWVALVVFALLTALFGSLVYGYLTIGYELGERFLVIQWAGRRDVIPLQEIKHIGPAIEALEEHPGRLQPFWPGYYVGKQAGKSGPVRVVATLPLRRQLLVSTENRQFAISPERPVLFVEEFGRLRRALDLQRSGMVPTVEPGAGARRLADAGWTMPYPVVAPGHSAEPTTGQAVGAPVPGATADLPAARSEAFTRGRDVSPVLRPMLLNDTTALSLLAVAVLLNVLMVGYILIRYDSIPPSIALHWNVNGLPDRIGSPREIWTLPLITGIVTVANFGLAWSIVTFDRFAARFLLAATGVVQLVAWVAVITLIH